MAAQVHDEPSEDVVENAKRDRQAQRGPIGRIILFFKQIFVELKKVVTPTRSELVNYTLVVLAFVAFMMALIWVLDTLVGLLVVWAFSNPGA